MVSWKESIPRCSSDNHSNFLVMGGYFRLLGSCSYVSVSSDLHQGYHSHQCQQETDPQKVVHSKRVVELIFHCLQKADSFNEYHSWISTADHPSRHELRKSFQMPSSGTTLIGLNLLAMVSPDFGFTHAAGNLKYVCNTSGSSEK